MLPFLRAGSGLDLKYISPHSICISALKTISTCISGIIDSLYIVFDKVRHLKHNQVDLDWPNLGANLSAFGNEIALMICRFQNSLPYIELIYICGYSVRRISRSEDCSAWMVHILDPNSKLNRNRACIIPDISTCREPRQRKKSPISPFYSTQDGSLTPRDRPRPFRYCKSYRADPS